MKQSGFEKDLEEIRTHLDCCRGGKLRILLLFQRKLFETFQNIFNLCAGFFFCVKEPNGSFQFFSAVPSIAIHLVIISLFDIFHMSEFDVLHLFVEFTLVA